MPNIKIFEEKKIRTQWNANEEDWYFSVVDVVRFQMKVNKLLLNL